MSETCPGCGAPVHTEFENFRRFCCMTYEFDRIPQAGADLNESETCLRRQLAQRDARIKELEDSLSAVKEWAHRIEHDERVCGWVHGEDYGLYCLLTDCPAEVREG